ncbi:hypothetical protein [Phycicoccus sp. 3266]|uniref:hypothetical protein n=1 Tax=Phycicoccus sp. 3266 TaxID=2817751 RepID=UPI00285713EC|nr:hypothetical protein [Phycicoccus sp. 3266]MDR6861966.1 hypothetical protein [Phycicoccus sp. 3266]
MSRHTSPFRSAFPVEGGPVSPAEILAFHHARFGGLRMEDTGGDGGQGGAGGQGGNDGGAGGNGGQSTDTFTDPDTGETYNFPTGKPTSEMTSEQREEYWRHKARKHEHASRNRADYDEIKAERDRLRAATQTDAEKAVEKAREEARTAAEAELRGKFAGQLVAAEFKAALAGKRDAAGIQTLVDGLDLTKFLTDTGEVDTDKVTQYAAGLAPAGGKEWPDTGQGNRGDHKPAKGVSAGADLFAASRGKQKTT